MSRFVLVCMLLASCYHTRYSSGTGEYRGHATHTGEQQVDSRRSESFDEQALRVTVGTTLLCRPTLVGDHLEERQVAHQELRFIPMIISGTLLTIGGLSIAGIGAADGATTDSLGQPRTPDYSDSERQQMEIGGLLAGALGIFEIVYVMRNVGDRERSDWEPVPGNPGSVITSTEQHECGAGAGIPGVQVHVVASFADLGRSLQWDLTTDETGAASLEADRLRTIAGWCGEGRVSVQTQDSSWNAAITGTPTPLDQITDAPARNLARACAHEKRAACLAQVNPGRWRDECLDACASRVDAQRCTSGRVACLGKSTGGGDDDTCADGFTECLDEEGVTVESLDACAHDCQDEHAATQCPEAS